MSRTTLINTEFGEAAMRDNGDGTCKVIFIGTSYTVNNVPIEDALGDKVIDYLVPRIHGKGFGDYHQARLSNFYEYKAIWRWILDEVYFYGRGKMDPAWHDFRTFRHDFKSTRYSRDLIKGKEGYKLNPVNNYYSKQTLLVDRDWEVAPSRFDLKLD